MDNTKIDFEELAKVSGGWEYDDLSPEDQEKLSELHTEYFNSYGTRSEPYCKEEYYKFIDYLNKKYK